MNAILDFKGFKVQNVEYDLIDFENFENTDNDEILEKIKNGQVNVDISARVFDDQESDFSHIDVNVNTTDKLVDEVRRVSITITGAFKINAPELDDNDREELLKINGTAILLPYCRNYLSNLTGFDTTYSQLLMPPFNVTTLFENQND